MYSSRKDLVNAIGAQRVAELTHNSFSGATNGKENPLELLLEDAQTSGKYDVFIEEGETVIMLGGDLTTAEQTINYKPSAADINNFIYKYLKGKLAAKSDFCFRIKSGAVIRGFCFDDKPILLSVRILSISN